MVVRRGVQKVFLTPQARGLLHWCEMGLHQCLGCAKDSWETFAPWAQKSQKNLLHPPLTTFGDLPFLGNFPGPQQTTAWPVGLLVILDAGGGGAVGNCLDGTGWIPGGGPKHGGSAFPSRTPPEAVTVLELHAVEG